MGDSIGSFLGEWAAAALLQGVLRAAPERTSHVIPSAGIPRGQRRRQRPPYRAGDQVTGGLDSART